MLENKKKLQKKTVETRKQFENLTLGIILLFFAAKSGISVAENDKINDFFLKQAISSYNSNSFDFRGGFHFLERHKNSNFYGKSEGEFTYY